MATATMLKSTTSTGDVSKRFYGPSMKQSGALATMMSTGTSGNGARGAKTLGWFMADTDLSLFADKKSTKPASSSDEERKNSITVNNNVNKQKRLRKTMSCQGAARKEGYSAGPAMSESSEEGYDEKRLQTILNDLTISKQSGSKLPSEEYWFYDVASDGYYYEQNGAKGWRRRMPNGFKKEEAKGAQQQQQQQQHQQNLLAAQAAQAALLHHALLQQQVQQQAQQAAAQQPTMRYYDPNSDGFYYEMASVDGWKRRQPNKPLSASVPAGITRPYAMRQAAEQQQHQQQMNQGPSYGAALARGQMPRNCVIDESSASSSICGDAVLQDLLGDFPVSRPNSLETNQQINPNFNAERFIRDLSFSGLAASNKIFTPASINTPSTAYWPSGTPNNHGPIGRPNGSCWNPSPIKSAAAMEDEMNMLRSLKDLDKIWAAPLV